MQGSSAGPAGRATPAQPASSRRIPNFSATKSGLARGEDRAQVPLAEGAARYGLQDVPLLTATTHSVSEAYDVLQWAVGTGEPGHTFVLVDRGGRIGWIRDYGAPENGGVMYVPIEELTSQIRRHLAARQERRSSAPVASQRRYRTPGRSAARLFGEAVA